MGKEKRTFGIAICFALCMSSLIPWGLANAEQQESGGIHDSPLFLPLASLVYGPNSTQIIHLSYRYAEVQLAQNYQKLVIYNPGTFIPKLNITHLPKGVDLQVIFDSFFVPNRQAPQIIPPISDVAVNLTKINNPLEASDITQMVLGSTSKLPFSNSDHGQHRHFVIPADVKPGDYLIDTLVSFGKNNMGAVYSNRVVID